MNWPECWEGRWKRFYYTVLALKIPAYNMGLAMFAVILEFNIQNTKAWLGSCRLGDSLLFFSRGKDRVSILFILPWPCHTRMLWEMYCLNNANKRKASTHRPEGKRKLLHNYQDYHPCFGLMFSTWDYSSFIGQACWSAVGKLDWSPGPSQRSTRFSG